jgi:putative FmdB family regulatory protein
MPIYEYYCEECGHEMEAMQKVSDEALRECPACGRPALKKMLSAPGFRLKGGGWYETDFKGDAKRKNVAETKTGDSPSTASESSGKAAKHSCGGNCACS